MQHIILYEKNNNSNHFDYLKSYDNKVSLYEKEFLFLNLFGKFSNTLWNTLSKRKFLICNSTYWGTTIPDPILNINGSIQSSSNLSFDKTTGRIIGLNINKKYILNINFNLNNLNVSRETNWTFELVNTDSNYNTNLNDSFGTNFSPHASCITAQRIANNGLGMTINYVITNTTSFTFLLSTSYAITTTTGNYDNNISISLLEI